MKNLYLTIMLFFSVGTTFAQNITGTWNGTLNYGTTKLRIVFHIEEKDGIYTTTLDSPDQAIYNIQTTKTTLKKKTLKINILKLFAVFEGKIKKDYIEGTFTQYGNPVVLTLTRGNIVRQRPQTPKPPLPYNSENVYFENKKDKIKLAGTFTYPKNGEKFPAVVLISGSGASNRDEEIFGHRPFAVIADFLTKNGIAVLRYDDRGTEESTGIYETATLQDFATDAMSAVSYLKERKEVNPQQIGLIGHSEGGSIAFIVAANESNLSFIVAMAAPTIKGDSLMKLQRLFISQKMGISDKQIQDNEILILKMSETITKHTADSVFNFTENFVDEIIPAKVGNNIRNVYKNELSKLASSEMQSLLLYSPAEDLQKIKCHLFAIGGENDLQVPAEINLNEISKLGKNNFTIHKYPNLNHLFQHCRTGLVTEYSEIEETISSEVLENICNWIIDVVR